MTTEAAVGPKGRLALGLVLVAIGLVLILEQAAILDVAGIGRFWPLLFIGIGIVKVRQPIEDGQRALGVALLFAGSLFQVLGVLSWGRGWPLVLIFVGGALLFRAFDGQGAPDPVPPLGPFVSELALVGGSKRSLRLPDFRGGYITAFMGGVELDLRKCKILTSPAVLDVVAFWGGINLKVPPEWSVEGKVLPIMGAFEDKTTSLVESSEAPRLVVRGYVVMGGVVVGN
jgi:hypothetical protein